jgi:hypothetical protein
MVNNFKQTNIPQGLSLQEFRSASDALGQFAKSCRFVVKINPSATMLSRLPRNDLIYMCEAAEFPGRGFDVTQIRYYGPSQVMPNNTMYNTSNLQFLCRSGSTERAFFDDWMEYINPTTSFNFEYPNNYYCTIQIFQFSEFGGVNAPLNAIYGWTLNKAWPTLVAPQQVTWADQDILRLQVTFAYKYWDRPDYVK